MPKYDERLKREYMSNPSLCNAANKAKEDGKLDDRERFKMINCQHNFYRCSDTECPYHV